MLFWCKTGPFFAPRSCLSPKPTSITAALKIRGSYTWWDLFSHSFFVSHSVRQDCLEVVEVGCWYTRSPIRAECRDSHLRSGWYTHPHTQTWCTKMKSFLSRGMRRFFNFFLQCTVNSFLFGFCPVASQEQVSIIGHEMVSKQLRSGMIMQVLAETNNRMKPK